MNRDDLLRAVVDETGEPIGIVELIVDTVFQTIKDEIGGGRAVSLEGFGNFFLRPAAAARSPHPHTGEMVEHPPYTQIVFRARGGWRSRINGGREEPAAVVERRYG